MATNDEANILSPGERGDKKGRRFFAARVSRCGCGRGVGLISWATRHAGRRDPGRPFFLRWGRGGWIKKGRKR